MATEALANHLAGFQLGPENLVFTNSFGRPLRRNAFGKVWHNAVANLDLASDATFHEPLGDADVTGRDAVNGNLSATSSPDATASTSPQTE